MSAVSRKVTPTSSAASTTARVALAVEPAAEVVAAEPDARDVEIRAAEARRLHAARLCDGSQVARTRTSATSPALSGGMPVIQTTT